MLCLFSLCTCIMSVLHITVHCVCVCPWCLFLCLSHLSMNGPSTRVRCCRPSCAPGSSSRIALSCTVYPSHYSTCDHRCIVRTSYLLGAPRLRYVYTLVGAARMRARRRTCMVLLRLFLHFLGGWYLPGLSPDSRVFYLSPHTPVTQRRHTFAKKSERVVRWSSDKRYSQ